MFLDIAIGAIEDLVRVHDYAAAHALIDELEDDGWTETASASDERGEG